MAIVAKPIQNVVSGYPFLQRSLIRQRIRFEIGVRQSGRSCLSIVNRQSSFNSMQNAPSAQIRQVP